MACKLYIAIYGSEIRAGTFPNREKAEEFYNRNKETFRADNGQLGKPIYVETGKGKRS